MKGLKLSSPPMSPPPSKKKTTKMDRRSAATHLLAFQEALAPSLSFSSLGEREQILRPYLRCGEEKEKTAALRSNGGAMKTLVAV